MSVLDIDHQKVVISVRFQIIMISQYVILVIDSGMPLQVRKTKYNSLIADHGESGRQRFSVQSNNCKSFKRDSPCTLKFEKMGKFVGDSLMFQFVIDCNG